MSAVTLLSKLRQRQVKLYLQDGKLKFSAPKGALTAELKAELIANKPQVIALLEKLSDKPAVTIAHDANRREFPLSFAQQRLWFIDHLDGQSSQYNITAAVELTGQLNVAALTQALTGVIERHQVLRSVYVQGEQGIVQVVQATTPLDLTVEMVNDDGAEIIAFERHQPFDLANDCMVRLRLLQSATDKHILVVTMHHIASDGWSIGVIVSELAALYNAACENVAAQLPALDIQYGDFALWQKGVEQQAQLAKMLQYWQQQLNDAPALHALPTDFARPAKLSNSGMVIRDSIDAKVFAQFKLLCQRQGATLFMGLQAILSLLHCRLGGEDDILLGTPAANRVPEQTESLIGFFVNTLVLRTKVDVTQGFTELLAQVKQTALDAFAHSQLPFEHLVDELVTERNLGYSPLIQHLLVVQNNEVNEQNLASRINLQGLTAKLLPVPVETTIYDTVTEFTEQDDQLFIRLEFSTELFNQQTMACWLRSLSALIQAVVDTPELAVSQLNMQAPTDRALIDKFAAAPSMAAPNKSLSQYFEQQAALTPEAPALRFGDLLWDYQTLNTKANQLAHGLMAKTHGASQPIAMLLPRGEQMVMAVLAILKTGNAYVPMDVTLPQGRINTIIDDAKPSVIITDSEHQAMLPADSELLVLEQANLDNQSDSNLSIALAQDPAAYILYSSGSTGRPKAIEMGNVALANLILAMQHHHPAMATPQITLQFASIGFDMSFTDMFVAFFSGGEVVLTEQAAIHDLAQLVALYQKHQINFTNLPYAMVQALCAYCQTEAITLTSLRTMVSTAEALKITPAIRDFFTRHANCQLLNHYGPTETHVVTATTMTGEPHTWPQIPPIGVPLANVPCQILDSHGQPTAMGVAGELYAGGLALAVGYRGQPQLTGEKFVELDNAQGERGRWYRTGDWVTWQSDGTIRYVGRRDLLVKLHGYRIELDEIEQWLSRYDGIVDVVVVVKGQEQNDGQNAHLVAYVTCSTDQFDSNHIIEFLVQQLPSYMVPRTIVKLDAMPLNVNGKVDKRALPEVELTVETQAIVAAETELEHQLLALWQQLLQNDNVGVCDNFFAVGGNSLLLTQLVHLAYRQHQLTIAVRDLFEHQTIRQLAQHIEQHQVELPQWQKQDATVPSALSYGQYRIWFTEQLNGPSSAHNMPGGVQINGAVDKAKLTDALNVLAQRHHVLNSWLCGESEPPVMLYDASLQHQIDELSLAGMSEQQVLAKREQHGREVFDVYQWPLCRFTLAKMSNGDHQLWLNCHHLISDGWSMRVFMSEWLECYEQLMQNQQPEIDTDALQYRDFVAWQQALLSSSAAQKQQAFWQDYLADCNTALSLPFEQVVGANQDFSGQTIRRKLSVTVLEKLNLLAQRHGGSLFNVYHSALALILARISGERDFNIGIPVTGRHIPGVEQMLGVLLNNLPLRSTLDLSHSFSQLLTAQIDNANSVLAAQDLPFEQILELAQVPRIAGVTPLFQVFLNVLSLPPAKHQCGELSATVLPSEVEQSKFNLTLYIQSDDDGLAIDLVFNRQLYPVNEIELLLNHYVALLEQVADAPELACEQYALSSMAQVQAKPEMPAPTHWQGSVVDLFEQQAHKNVLKRAIGFAKGDLSYAELAQAVSAVAGYLQAQGIVKGDVVSVMAERSPQLVATVLGILKAGATFHLVADTMPQVRIEAQTAFANSKMLLSLADFNHWQGYDFTAVAIDFDDAAYLSFTSGTEGKPKAVVGTHGGLAGLVKTMATTFELNASIDVQSRFGMLSSLVHDPLQRDMFTPLCLGAELMIPTIEQFAVDKLGLFLAQQQVNHLHLTPGMGKLLTSHFDSGKLPSLTALQRVFFVGESLTVELVERFNAIAPNVKVVNLYGSTETSRAVGYFDTAIEAAVTNSFVPVGRGLAGVELAVVNSQLQPCAIGEVGQIVVKSPYIAKGYLHNPRLTAQQFVSFDQNGVRGYLTGDLGRIDAKGLVNCLGRIDRQVKVQGYRIELSEIEVVLAQVPQVEDCAVSAVKAPNGDTQLAAVVQNQQAQSLTESEREQLLQTILQYLHQKLPQYMVPQHVLILACLPMTQNRKLDHGRVQQLVSFSEQRVAPRDPTERQLFDIWCQLLDRDDFGIKDNFFDLGGHSLLISEGVQQLKQQFDIELNHRDFFTAANIQAQAVLVSEKQLVKKVMQQTEQPAQLIL